MDSLLSAGTDPNASDSDGKPALYVVVEHGRGNPGILSSLLKGGANPDKVTYNTQQTALHISCRKGYQVCVKALIAAKASVNKQDAVGNTGLHYASKEGHVTILRYLLDHKADVNCRNNNGETPLHICVKSKHNNCIKELMCHGADPGLSDNKGQNALLLALKLENIELIDMLLEYKCSVNAQDTQTGKTVLHWAIQGGNLSLVEKLLGLNADPNVRDREWQTPFLLALNMNRKDILECLMRAGCDITVTDRSFNTALHLASINGHPNMIQLLLDKRLPIDLKGSGGLSPLMLASLGGHFAAVRVLLEYGANCSLTDRNHASALVYAMLSSGPDQTIHGIIKLLIRANCDVSYAANLLKVTNTFNIGLGEGINIEERLYTPLEIAFLKGDPAIFSMLLAAGCDVSKFQCDKDMTMMNFRSIHSEIRSRWILLRCIKKERKRVKSLKELCRRPLLKTFKRGVQSTIRALPVSEELKSFLFFSDLDHICERYAKYSETESSSVTPPSSPVAKPASPQCEQNGLASPLKTNRLRSTFHNGTSTRPNTPKSPTTPVLPRATWDKERKKTTDKKTGKARSISSSEKPMTEKATHARTTSETGTGFLMDPVTPENQENKSKSIFDFLKRSKPKTKDKDSPKGTKARSIKAKDPRDTISSLLHGTSEEYKTSGKITPKPMDMRSIEKLNEIVQSPKADYDSVNNMLYENEGGRNYHGRSRNPLDLSQKVHIEGVSVNGLSNGPRHIRDDVLSSSHKEPLPKEDIPDELFCHSNGHSGYENMNNTLPLNATGSLNRPRRKKKQLGMNALLYGEEVNGNITKENPNMEDNLPRRRSNSASQAERQKRSNSFNSSNTSASEKPQKPHGWSPDDNSNLKEDITKMAQSISSTFENYGEKYSSPLLRRACIEQKNNILNDSKAVSPQVDVGYQTQESSIMSPTSTNSKSSFDSSNSSGANIQFPTGDAQLLQKYLHSQTPVSTDAGDPYTSVNKNRLNASMNSSETSNLLNQNDVISINMIDPEIISTSSILSNPSCDSCTINRRERHNSDSISSLSSSDSRKTPSKIPILQPHWTPQLSRSRLPIPTSPVSTPQSGYGSFRRSKSFRKY